ncbi:MAG: tRNA guanosine(34) transglycosylase Tgt [Myxococcota bacterium]
MNRFPFRVDATAGRARAGTLELPHGEVKTPVFMPVGTQGAVRSVPPHMVEQTEAQIVLANTYHLSQRPGEKLVRKHGGLHQFMGLSLPLLTDSGGFQVFSLDKEVTEEGVAFAYEVDGRKTFLSPERSMEIQQDLGADVAMVFDECVAFETERDYVARSIERTTRWEARCREVHTREDQALFGIVQGAGFEDLRRASAEAIVDLDFDGYAIGGLSVGEGHHEMMDVLDVTTPHLPHDRPRYLMGVGRPIDLVEAVARGVDMFDCVIQTRHARSGIAWTWGGRIRLTDKRYRSDMYPIDTNCTCPVCRTHTRAYLNHLLRVKEVLSATLISMHNIAWFQQFMAEMRRQIEAGTFEAFRSRIQALYPPDAPQHQRKTGKRGR